MIALDVAIHNLKLGDKLSSRAKQSSSEDGDNSLFHDGHNIRKMGLALLQWWHLLFQQHRCLLVPSSTFFTISPSTKLRFPTRSEKFKEIFNLFEY